MYEFDAVILEGETGIRGLRAQFAGLPYAGENLEELMENVREEKS